TRKEILYPRRRFVSTTFFRFLKKVVGNVGWSRFSFPLIRKRPRKTNALSSSASLYINFTKQMKQGQIVAVTGSPQSPAT
ncbi:MAG: hypothetical protein Q4C41_10015, partial [Eggerthellaceae bacterium]|nr:hypothetical protein [Eggerthellaceae bacterium]